MVLPAALGVEAMTDTANPHYGPPIERSANGPDTAAPAADYTELRGRTSPRNPDISARYAFHPAGPIRGAQHEGIRANFEWLAQLLDELLPPSREASLAQTELQAACQWANAALAIHGEDS